jgi:predicted nucleic acid-binding protein
MAVPAEPVFVDTSGWIAILSEDDQLHGFATAQLVQLGKQRCPLVTTDWVLAETGNGVARTRARAGFRRFVETLLQSPLLQLVGIDVETFNESLIHFDRAADKTWGLIDCASFVVMEREQIRSALTADRPFQQAGFQCLLPVD